MLYSEKKTEKVYNPVWYLFAWLAGLVLRRGLSADLTKIIGYGNILCMDMSVDFFDLFAF